MNPHTRHNTAMTTAQQESQAIPTDGLTAILPRPDISNHHNAQGAQELRQDQHSCHPTSSPPDPSSQAASLSDTAQAISPIDATHVCNDGEPIPDTVSGSSEDQPAGTLDCGPDHVEGRIPAEEASQATVDSSNATLTGGVKSTQQPCTAPSATVEPAITVCEIPERYDDEAKISPRLPIAESLGLWACVTLAGGTILTLAVLGFLVFLWAGEGPAGGERASFVWRKIMLSESWPAQTITICAVIVRTIAAAQAAICTSLVAALLLERRRLPLSKAVPVSIKRGVNDGPFNLFRDLVAWKSFWRLFCVETFLLLVVTMLSFEAQFTSTVLLSGFGTATLVQFPQQLHQNVLFSAEAALKAENINSFSQFPPSYALFGELETSNTPDPNAMGVSDTGKKLRSFVPFEKEQRTKLRAYTGPALSELTQVMCMRPSMDAEILWEKVVTEIGTMPETTISGTISYEKTFEEAALNNWTNCSEIQRFDGTSQTTCLPQHFSCTLPLQDMLTADPDPAIALCHLESHLVGDSTEIKQVANREGWNRSNPLWSASANPWTFLTFSTNLSVTAAEQELRGKENSSISLKNPANTSEWKTYQVIPMETLNVSLCFAGVRTDMYNVSMSTTVDPREPEVRWDPIHREDGAEPGQIFMGATGANLSAAERGILSISELKNPDGLKTEDSIASANALLSGPAGFTGMFAGSFGGSWIMCSLCALVGWAIPPDIGALFARTIHTTGRASWAIQIFLTTYTESWYAQILPQFDVAADIDVTFSNQFRIPRRWEPLAATLVLVVLNLACVWTITALYVFHTRYSRQGNLWHTVSQIMSEETNMVLEQSNQVKDREVEKGLKAGDYLMFIGKPRGSEKVSMLRA